MTYPAVVPVSYDIHFVDRAVNAPDWRWDSRLNRWDGHLLWFVAGGRGVIREPGQSGVVHHVARGDCFVFDMRRRFLGETEADAPLEIRAVGFRVRPDRRWRLHRRLRRPDLLRELMDSCIDARRGRDDGKADHWLRSALMAVEEEDARPRLSGRERERQSAVDRLCERVRADPAADWSSPVLAAELGCGREHLIRLFRRHVGSPPNEWLIAVRLERARQLLRFGSQTIGAVAAAVGYGDPFYFSRLFRQRVGVGPRDYRRSGWHEDEGNAR